jgi:hypothetical protein
VAILSLYNHTRARFASGANAVGDTYKVKLFTAATFNATHTTEAAAGGTEVADGNGYTTGGKTLTGVVATIVNTDEGRFDADDVIWTPTSAGWQASYARIYNDTDADDPPVAFIDFEGVEVAEAGIPYRIVWNVAGIIRFGKPVS